MTTSKLTGRLARWSLLLQEYEFEIQHKLGVENVVVDCCSRFPLPSIEDAFRDQGEELGVLWSAAAGVANHGAEDFASSPATYFAFHQAAPAAATVPQGPPLSSTLPSSSSAPSPLAATFGVTNRF